MELVDQDKCREVRVFPYPDDDLFYLQRGGATTGERCDVEHPNFRSQR